MSTKGEEFTLIIIGGGGVGKTCITCRLTGDKYDENYNPTIEETYVKQMTVNDQSISLTIVDTAGQEEYAVLRDQYWRTGDGFLFVFDVTNHSSFEALNGFYDSIVKAKEIEPLPIVLCANKCDLDRSEWKVSEEQMTQLSKTYSWAHFSTSAKNMINVQESLDEVVKRMIKFRRVLESGGADGTPEEEGNDAANGDGSDGKKKNMKGLFKSLFRRKK